MPNHVTHLVTVTGADEDIDAFLAKHFILAQQRGGVEGKCFTFDSIVPMPQCIKDTIRDFAAAPVGDAQVELYARALTTPKRHRLLPNEHYPWMPQAIQTWGDVKAWLDETVPDAAKWAKRQLVAAAETGHPGWYEWSIESWGTKWDAYSTRDIERRERDHTLSFRFETAWSFPEPIFEKLSEMYPSLLFITVSHDEGGPCYRGKYSKSSGFLAKVSETYELLDEVYGKDKHYMAETTDEDDV